MGRRVVVTGLGVLTPLGHSLAATLDALERGASAVAPARRFDAFGFACADAAEIRDWDARPAFRTPKALKLADRPAQFAVAAAGMALADASWPGAGEHPALGVAIGVSGSDLLARDLGRALAGDPDGACVRDIAQFAERMVGSLNPLWLLINLPNMISAHVAIQLAARGPNTTVMSDWIAGHQAIGEAAEWIRAGNCDAVLAGGADTGVQPFAYTAFQQAGWFAARRPTESADASARFVPGEGAAVLLLEEREAALSRGATPRAELAAYAVRPPAAGERHARALTRAACDALTEARWRREEVNLCTVAAPPVDPFAREVCHALRTSFGGVPHREAFDTRLGFPLAAAGPIDAALAIASCAPGTRILSSTIGSSGEAVTLAFSAGGGA